MKRLLESDPDVEEAGLSGDSSPFNAFWFEHHFFQTPDDPRVSVCFFPYFVPKIFSKNWMRKFTGVSPIFDGKNPWVSCKFSPTNQSSERSPWLPPRSLARSSWSKDQRRQVWWFPFDPCDRPLMPWNWVGKLRDYRRGRGGKSMGNFWEIHGKSMEIAAISHGNHGLRTWISWLEVASQTTGTSIWNSRPKPAGWSWSREPRGPTPVISVANNKNPMMFGFLPTESLMISKTRSNSKRDTHGIRQVWDVENRIPKSLSKQYPAKTVLSHLLIW